MKELQDINLKDLIEQETGQRFDRSGHICCPFHNEKTPSFSVKFIPNANKDRYHCWGCDAKGDAIDFIMNLKGMDYKSAREYLGLKVEKTEIETFEDKVRDYIDWQLQDFKRGYKLLGLFTFVDENNKPIYCKAKFLKQDGKKETPYYHIENGKVINNRGCDEVPYNYYNLLQGIANNKTIVFVEGEKDVNTINNTLSKKDFVSTSIKGFKDYDKIKGEFMKVAVIGDTGEAGYKYIDNIKYNFIKVASSFRVINLPNIKSLGDNKDVTDWLEAGHTKGELLKAFDRSLDLKDKFELQQDNIGIYKLKFNKNEEDSKPVRVHLTDFNILEANKINKVDADVQGIRLKLKSCIDGKVVEKVGSSKIFDDLKSFRNFLGMDFSFTGVNVGELVSLKSWVNKYFAIDNESIYTGTQWVKNDEELYLITGDGAIKSYSNDCSMISDTGNIKILDKEKISTDELKELKSKLFKFWDPEKSVSIIGTVINDLAAWHNEEGGFKQHLLLIVGESQSGKSTILEKVIAPLLNINADDKKSMSSSPFSIQVELSKGNYPILFDEFKPSTMDKYKIKKLSDIFRSTFDRHAMNKGDKSFKVREFKLKRPLIIAGEENFPNSETAVITRSCIVYLSRRERTEKSAETMKWLSENQNILNKFGRSLIDILLKMSVKDYIEIRRSKEKCFKNLKERVFNTALNIATGIEIYNKLLRNHGISEITNYEDYIYKNLKEEILEDGEDTKSLIEKMLILYNDMIETGRAFDFNNVIINKGDGLFIKTSEMINQIHIFVKQVESAEIVPLKLKDFKKQATKSGYLKDSVSKVIKVNGKPIRFDEYSKERMRELQVNSIIEAEITQIEMTDKDKKVIEGVFGAKVP